MVGQAARARSGDCRVRQLLHFARNDLATSEEPHNSARPRRFQLKRRFAHSPGRLESPIADLGYPPELLRKVRTEWSRPKVRALSTEELGGYQLFKSLGCSSCHQGVNVGGNLFERQGIFRPLVVPKPEIVRVPSLRNVAATAPYFHDGSEPSLHDAVRKMAAAQLDRTLSDQQVDSIVAFLRTLTGVYRGRPVAGAPP